MISKAVLHATQARSSASWFPARGVTCFGEMEVDDNDGSRNAPSGAIPTNTKPTTRLNETASKSTSRYERIPLNTNTMRTATYEEVQIQRHDTITLKSAPGPFTVVAAFYLS